VRMSTVDLETRDRLVLDHVSLVRSVAQRLAQRLPPQVEVSELVSVGVLGLVEAANRYRPGLGVPFDAFARRRVHGAMLDALRGLDWAPRSLRRMRRELDRSVGRLRHELGREPREEEIAADMGMPADRFALALEDLRVLELATVRTIDAASSEGESLLDLIVDPDEGAVERLQRKELRAHLARALETIPERERQILALSYDEELTLAEIGQVIGVSESRVCQLRSLALSRLRASLTESLRLGARA
jgi:RNA polymerase sigma factor FliA